MSYQSWVRLPVWVDVKTFIMIGNLLTISVSIGLSRESNSILLKTHNKTKNNTITFPYKMPSVDKLVISN